MDPTSWISKLDQSVKSVLILLAGASVCIGFFLKLISQEQFMPFVYTVIGAGVARTMMGGMSAFSKTTSTGPDGAKTETTTSLPPATPPLPHASAAPSQAPAPPANSAGWSQPSA